MRSAAERELALSLAEAGLNDCEISRRTGVPRSTVRDWRGRQAGADCPRCWRPLRRPIVASPGDYAELLALYLGDGCLARDRRSMRLRVSLDAAHPAIVEHAQELLRRCFPLNRIGVGTADRGSTVILSVYSTHLECLLPQHGPGKKHERTISLEPWQLAFVESAPWRFIRGCIHSDGCVFINRTGPYRYLSYDFSNRSADILQLFTYACDQVGVEYRAYARSVRVYRRASVALLQEHVGVKR